MNPSVQKMIQQCFNREGPNRQVGLSRRKQPLSGDIVRGSATKQSTLKAKLPSPAVKNLSLFFSKAPREIEMSKSN